MPRRARIESGTGIFHVMMRGINHQNIFEDEEDRWQFINTLDRMRVRETLRNELHLLCLLFDGQPLPSVDT